MLKSLDEKAKRPSVIELATAPDDVVPDDTGPVIARLRVTARAVIDGLQKKPTPIGFFAKLPLEFSPVIRLAKQWLDRKVTGMPDE